MWIYVDLQDVLLISILRNKSFINPLSFTLVQVCRVDTSHYELNSADDLLENADG